MVPPPTADPVGSFPEEETPFMRAVPMMRSPSLREPYESRGLSLGKSPLAISRPSVAFGVKQEWRGLASPAVWDVTGQDLELVPMDFPLERTHREINDDASKVAARISDILRALSIETEFDCENAKAKCKTNDCVCFRIRLYAGNESGEPVIVEVQRRNGSVASFMRSCRAILDAAEGKEAVRKQPTLPPFMQKPIGQMKCLQSLPLAVKAPASPIENVIDMLRSNNRDTNMLGLENLCCLTDPVKTVTSVAIHVSRAVIIGDDVRDEIRALTERDIFALDDERMSRHEDQLRHLALSVFANALSVCSKDGCLTEAVKKQNWFADHLIPSLLDELKRSESCANVAYQAVCCLQSLVACSDVAEQLVVNNGGVAILEEAYAVGSRRHELLASQTMLCLRMVGSSHFESTL